MLLLVLLFFEFVETSQPPGGRPVTHGLPWILEIKSASHMRDQVIYRQR
jgi:hypothetical protein